MTRREPDHEVDNPDQQERDDSDDEQEPVPLPTISPIPTTCVPRLILPRPNAPTPATALHRRRSPAWPRPTRRDGVRSGSRDGALRPKTENPRVPPPIDAPRAAATRRKGFSAKLLVAGSSGFVGHRLCLAGVPPHSPGRLRESFAPRARAGGAVIVRVAAHTGTPGAPATSGPTWGNPPTWTGHDPPRAGRRSRQP